MVASAANGTQTAVVTTEHTLATEATAGVYVLMVDLSNLVNGDVVELRLKTRVLTGDTSLQLWTAVYANVQADVLCVSLPVASPFEIIATLKQTAGTARNFKWSLNSL